jgi:hypothetical protein
MFSHVVWKHASSVSRRDLRRRCIQSKSNPPRLVSKCECGFRIWRQTRFLTVKKVRAPQKGGAFPKKYIYKLQIDDEFTITGPKRPTP